MTPLVASHVELISLEWLRSHGVMVGIVLVMALLVSWFARLAVRRMERRMEAAETLTAELNLQRTATITQALHHVIRVVVWTLAVLLILGEVGISLGPLLAGAGIAGVALGFGAQSIVRDFLSGFFILLENQYGVGDIIVVNANADVAGKVEQISMRTTQIRSFDGTLHIIPNGNIEFIGNRTKGWARAVVDIGVAYAEDVRKVREVLEELFDEVREDEDLQRRIYDGPTVLGVENLGEYEVVIRCVADVRPPYQWEIQRELRRRIKERFDERGIEIPFPYRVMISRNAEPHGDESTRQPQPEEPERTET
jgi:moderate conductance mechanosensitive channel